MKRIRFKISFESVTTHRQPFDVYKINNGFVVNNINYFKTLDEVNAFLIKEMKEFYKK
jgi:hypothetical protein